MHARIVKPKRCPAMLVRPLRRGDIETVAAMFARLGERSRRIRFNGPKPRLIPSDLEQLAAADPNHHVLVAYVPGDPRPAAIARLVRSGASAEIAFEIADELQHRGIGAALTGELIADARAAGITEITPLVASFNPAALALLRRILEVLDVRFDGPELWIRAALRDEARPAHTRSRWRRRDMLIAWVALRKCGWRIPGPTWQISDTSARTTPYRSSSRGRTAITTAPMRSCGLSTMLTCRPNSPVYVPTSSWKAGSARIDVRVVPSLASATSVT